MARILLAEDDRVVLEVFERALVRSGHEVETFGDGASACEALSERPFDVVVTDLHMPPGKGGIAVVKAAHERRPGALVFVLSGSSRECEREEVLAAGARAVLQKPLDLRLLCDLIEKATMSEREKDQEARGAGAPRVDRPEKPPQRNEPTPAGESSGAIPLGPLAAPRVLVLEPEASLRKLLEYCLKRQGLRVTATGDEGEALEIASLEPPDAAIAGGPEDDRRALAFVEGLRRDAACARTHVVFLYPEGAIADAVQALDLGADAALERPVEPEILFAQVRAGVRRCFRREAIAISKPVVTPLVAPPNGNGNGHGHGSSGNGKHVRAGS
jgi:DNA-binding response OmpR family regulator